MPGFASRGRRRDAAGGRGSAVLGCRVWSSPAPAAGSLGGLRWRRGGRGGVDGIGWCQRAQALRVLPAQPRPWDQLAMELLAFAAGRSSRSSVLRLLLSETPQALTVKDDESSAAGDGEAGWVGAGLGPGTNAVITKEGTQMLPLQWPKGHLESCPGPGPETFTVKILARSEGSINGSHHSWPSAGASSRARLPLGPSGQTGPASAAVVSQGSRQVALHLGAHAPELAGSAGGLDDQGLPGRIPPPHSTRAAQVRFPAQATGTATLTEVEADCPARGRERGPGGAPPSPRFTPGPAPAPGPAGCALCGCENPERRIGARSQPTPPRSGSRAGHAQCGRRAAVRQLGSSRSSAVGARTPAAASRRRPPPPDSGKLRGVPGARPGETDTLQTGSNLVPPAVPHPNPNHGGCGRRSAAAAGSPCPLAGDQQPLEGQQRVKSAPSHRERGPLQPPRPLAALLGACPEPPRAPEPRMRHRSPAGV
nr:unnamed protein product [Rangifer tarandus platyrhynchus]